MTKVSDQQFQTEANRTTDVPGLDTDKSFEGLLNMLN